MIVGDETRLEVQSYARVRIVDPLRFYQALRTNEMANAQLAQLVSSSTRRALGQVPLRALLTEERGHILDVIKGEVAAKAAPLGIEVEEVRFDRSDMVRNQPGDLTARCRPTGALWPMLRRSWS
jgi:membrane protease subunit HflC